MNYYQLKYFPKCTLVICMFIFLLSFSLSAQNKSKIDSLTQLLQTKKLNDTTKINIYNELCWPLYSSVNSDSSIKYGLKAIELSSKTKDTTKLIIALRRIGIAFINKGDHETAEKYEQKSFDFAKAKNNKKAMASALTNLSVIQLNIANYKKAINYSIQSQKLQEEIKDSTNLFNTYYNLGILFKDIDDSKNAKYYYRKSYQIAVLQKNKSQIAHAINSIGILFKHENNLDSALFYFKEAESIFENEKNTRGLIESYGSLGGLYSNNPSTARLSLNYFLKALELNKQINDEIALGTNLGNIAFTYLNMGKADSAIYYGLASLASTKKTGDNGEIVFATHVLSNAYKMKGDHKNSLIYLTTHLQLKDSLFNIEKQKEISQMQISYEFDKRTIADSLKAIEAQKIQTEKEKQETTIKYSLVIIALLLLIFSVIMFNRFKITDNQKNVIESQKHIVDEKQKEILDSINYAKKIQFALLANRELLDRKIKDYFIYFKPKDIVSGDFYWATQFKNRFYIAVCDSTGHGVPGAFMSLLSINFLNEAINEKFILETDEVFNFVRKRLIETFSNEGQKDGFDGILICIDEETKKITYTAANNKPILCSGNTIKELISDRMPVGKGEKADSFTKHEIDYVSGDILFLYTDGYADQFGGEKGKKFKYKKLNELLLNVSVGELKDQETIISAKFVNWKGNLEQVDDVCLIGLKL